MRAFVIDAFTDVMFRGNPAGVVILDDDSPRRTDAAWMQDVAAEFKHAETAFVARRPDGEYDLRWFTPAVEVDLCGHATLATAHALAGEGGGPRFVFNTRSGKLAADVGANGSVTLDFPAQPPSPVEPPPGLAGALGCVPVSVHANGIDVLVELADEDAVADVSPDFDALVAFDCRGVIVTAQAAPHTDYDFVSRFFAPAVGVPEDPVTGSAHCALAPFWVARLGKNTLVGVQLSARKGRVGVSLLAGGRVALTGAAVTVLAGALAD